MVDVVNNIEDTLKMSMLLDFYGALLTEKQRDYFSMYYDENLSLTEIAERENISKQAVHVLISRAEKKLVSIEQKTGFLKRWNDTRSALGKAQNSGDNIHPAALEYFEL